MPISGIWNILKCLIKIKSINCLLPSRNLIRWSSYYSSIFVSLGQNLNELKGGRACSVSWPQRVQSMVTRQLSSHVVGRRQAEWETSSCLDFSCSIYPVPGLPVHGLILFPFRLGSPSLVNFLCKCLLRSTHRCASPNFLWLKSQLKWQWRLIIIEISY